MLITENIAQKVLIKRSVNKMTKTELARLLNISTHTLLKIENGNYKAPKRIYQSVMEWLTEDLWRQQKKALTPTKVSSLFLQNTKHKLSAGKQDNQGVSIFHLYSKLYYIYHTKSSYNGSLPVSYNWRQQYKWRKRKWNKKKMKYLILEII